MAVTQLKDVNTRPVRTRKSHRTGLIMPELMARGRMRSVLMVTPAYLHEDRTLGLLFHDRTNASDERQCS